MVFLTDGAVLSLCDVVREFFCPRPRRIFSLRREVTALVATLKNSRDKLIALFLETAFVAIIDILQKWDRISRIPYIA